MGQPEKRAVLERDGWKCVDCGMTNAEHVAYFHRRLHVHRLVPGHGYTTGNCVTLCDKCHKKRHGAKRFAAKKSSPRPARAITGCRQIPTDIDAQPVRLELAPAHVARLAEVGSPSQLSVSGLAHLVMGLVADSHPSTRAIVEAAYAEANRLRGRPKG